MNSSFWIDVSLCTPSVKASCSFVWPVLQTYEHHAKSKGKLLVVPKSVGVIESSHAAGSGHPPAARFSSRPARPRRAVFSPSACERPTAEKTPEDLKLLLKNYGAVLVRDSNVAADTSSWRAAHGAT